MSAYSINMPSTPNLSRAACVLADRYAHQIGVVSLPRYRSAKDLLVQTGGSLILPRPDQPSQSTDHAVSRRFHGFVAQEGRTANPLHAHLNVVHNTHARRNKNSRPCNQHFLTSETTQYG